MCFFRFFLLSIILLITNQLAYSQITYNDTVIAGKYLTIGDIFYNKKQIDSSTFFYQKAGDIYKNLAVDNNDNLMWKKHIKCLYYIGLNFKIQNNYNNAQKKFKQSLNLTNKYLDSISVLASHIYNALGDLYKKKSEYKKSLNSFNQCLKIRKKIWGQDNKHLAYIYSNIGLVYSKISKYDTALIFYEKAQNTFNKFYNHDNVKISALYSNMGIAYTMKSEYKKALKHFFKAVNIGIEFFGINHPWVANTYNSIGNVYTLKGQYNEALKFYFKSLKIRKRIFKNNHIFISSSYNNIGNVYSYKSEYNKALEYYNSALLIRKNLLDDKNILIAEIYANIADVYIQKNQYITALQYLHKSMKMYNNILGENNIYIAENFNKIAKVSAYLSEYENAYNYYLKSISIYKNIFSQDHIGIANVYKNIADLNYNKQIYDSALNYYSKSIKIFRNLLGNKHPKIGETYYSIAETYLKQDKHLKAIKYYQLSAVSLLPQFKNKTEVYKLPNIDESLDWLTLIKTINAKAELLNFLSEKKNTDSLLFFKKLSLNHYKTCDSLLTLARTGISLKKDKLSLGKQASKIYKNAVNTCVKLSNYSKIPDNYLKQAFYFSERNKSSVLLEALASAQALKFAEIPDSLLNLEKQLRIDIANYKNLQNNAKTDSLENIWNSRLFSANRTYDSLISVFEKKYPKYFNLKYNNSPATVKEIANILDKKTAMLSYFIGDSTITVFAIAKKTFFRRNNFLVKQIPKPDSFDIKIFYYRQVISDPEFLQNEKQNNTHNSVEIYEQLSLYFFNLFFPEKIKNFLNKKRIKNLIIIPDGIMAKLPFETFLTEKYNTEWTNWDNENYFSKMPFLLKKYVISYSYSASLFLQTHSKNKPKNPELTSLNDWIGFAPVFDNENISGTTRRTRKIINSTFNSDNNNLQRSFLNGTYISPLPGTKTEVENIFQLFNKNNKKAVVKTYNNASEKAVKNLNLKKYKILHFATHGLVNEIKPEYSAILLAQDTSSKTDSLALLLANVEQQNEGFLYQSEIYNLNLNANLVVLSACETALGKISEGEGVIGLTRALLYAGTRNIIVSLWQVNDKSTKNLMIYFYKNMLNNHKNLVYAKNLQKAKLKMIKQGKYAHPYFWSPFILIGQ